jgi:hypothetical protein
MRAMWLGGSDDSPPSHVPPELLPPPLLPLLDPALLLDELLPPELLVEPLLSLLLLDEPPLEPALLLEPPPSGVPPSSPQLPDPPQAPAVAPIDSARTVTAHHDAARAFIVSSLARAPTVDAFAARIRTPFERNVQATCAPPARRRLSGQCTCRAAPLHGAGVRARCALTTYLSVCKPDVTTYVAVCTRENGT